MKAGIGPVPKYLPQLSEEETRTTVSRKPSTALFLLDSADRPFVRSPASTFEGTPSSWSDFRVQKPEALLQSFARRIQPVEVRFPWYIPNIVSSSRYSSNNVLYLSVAEYPDLISITIPMGYYAPADLVLALNLAISAKFTALGLVISPPTFSYSGYKYTLTNPALGSSYMSPLFSPNGLNTTVQQWRGQASLLKTMGFQFEQVSGIFPMNAPATMTGLVTLTSYTDYVDITSNKLNLFAEVKDGSSAPGGTGPIICRLYANNEISYNPDQAWTPFIIHRQFPVPKTIEWNPESTIDWFDVQVLDMYGLPVPTPAYKYNSGTGVNFDSASYPDFQITFQASEN